MAAGRRPPSSCIAAALSVCLAAGVAHGRRGVFGELCPNFTARYSVSAAAGAADWQVDYHLDQLEIYASRWTTATRYCGIAITETEHRPSESPDYANCTVTLRAGAMESCAYVIYADEPPAGNYSCARDADAGGALCCCTGIEACRGFTEHAERQMDDLREHLAGVARLCAPRRGRGSLLLSKVKHVLQDHSHAHDAEKKAQPHPIAAHPVLPPSKQRGARVTGLGETLARRHEPQAGLRVKLPPCKPVSAEVNNRNEGNNKNVPRNADAFANACDNDYCKGHWMRTVLPCSLALYAVMRLSAY